ncbi:branched-chain amino acid--2-keto-4-methylthiobutyrate aminotransferase [Mesorhizobium loti]|nr:aminotransferase class IV [Mesorhizobium loti]PLP59071.1 branched-chain amino acid--2-keto-4-methylthiobutyrate aminotransferase [Mesorhizobium loti]
MKPEIAEAFAEALKEKDRFVGGAAYIDGRFMPLAEAAIPIGDWAYRRSDVTYDVASVWKGNFFRLDDHIDRFRRSMTTWRFTPQESDGDIRDIALAVVALSQLRDAYVGMDCLRGKAKLGLPSHPANARNYIAVFARPFGWLIAPEVQLRGAHLIIAATPRIPDSSVDPRVKNFHWGDLTQALFEAHDRGADGAILLDHQGFVTEGPGYNVFAVLDGTVVVSDHGALEGITRRTVIELCQELGIPVAVRLFSGDELREADEVFLSTTAGGIMPAARLDDRILGNDRPGPVASRLREIFWLRREAGWHGLPVNYQLPVPAGVVRG